MLIFFLIIICLFSSAGFDETFLNSWEREIDEKSCCHFGGVNYLKALIWVSFKLRQGYRTCQGWSLLNFSLLFYLNIGACMCAHVDVHVCTCICACVCLDTRRSDNNFAVASWVPFTLILLFNFYLFFENFIKVCNVSWSHPSLMFAVSAYHCISLSTSSSPFIILFVNLHFNPQNPISIAHKDMSVGVGNLLEATLLIKSDSFF